MNGADAQDQRGLPDFLVGAAPHLRNVLRELIRISEEHSKCLGCHCYRDAAAQAMDLADLLTGHRELAGKTAGAAPREPAAAEEAFDRLPVFSERLRNELESRPGTHG